MRIDNSIFGLRLFLKETTDEIKLIEGVDKHIEKIVDMGFLRRLQGNDKNFEVQRILRGFVDAEWLARFETNLEAYRLYANGGKEDERQ